jgi:NIPSNAP
MSKSMFLFVAGLALAVGGLAMVKTTAAQEKGKERVFELRTYVAADGKLDALNARFRDHTNKLFVKHGMELIGYWTPVDENKGASNTLIYVLAHANRDAADKSWKAFRDDPEWKAALADSEKNGKLTTKVESVFMKPTDYSPMK